MLRADDGDPDSHNFAAPAAEDSDGSYLRRLDASSSDSSVCTTTEVAARARAVLAPDPIRHTRYRPLSTSIRPNSPSRSSPAAPVSTTGTTGEERTPPLHAPFSDQMCGPDHRLLPEGVEWPIHKR